jgi:hypothetical protein
MRDYHRSPLLSWRPPRELSGWARDEAKRRGQRIGDFLSSLLAAERERSAEPNSINQATVIPVPGSDDTD